MFTKLISTFLPSDGNLVKKKFQGIDETTRNFRSNLNVVSLTFGHEQYVNFDIIYDTCDNFNVIVYMNDIKDE